MMMVMTKTMVMMIAKADEDSDDDENEDNDDIIEQEEALSFDVAAPLITLAFSLWRLLEFSSRSQNGSICRAPCLGETLAFYERKFRSGIIWVIKGKRHFENVCARALFFVFLFFVLACFVFCFVFFLFVVVVPNGLVLLVLLLLAL